MIGQIVSHYRITRQLGAGGMGVVYEARDLKLDRAVALKFLPPELTRDPEAKARFVHEARAASALDHPNICTIHEINETDDGRLFIAMACYEGETLKQRIARGPLPLDEAIDIVQQVTRGLAKAHEQEIVHRDIKPANIFITKDGLVKIVDFGLAKLAGQTRMTRTGSALGTVAYMSPEQARGAEVGPPTDIWSLGVVCYEMLTGQLPFPGDRNEAVIYSILSTDPVPLSGLRSGLAPRLEQIIERCLEKDPLRRYANATELLTAIETLTSELALGIQSRRSLSFRRWRRKRRMRLALAATAVVVTAAVMLRLFMTPQRGIDSIAVLPMTNLSGDPDQDYLADGMTDALINELAHIGAVRVISRTSVMQYKNYPRPLPQIASELGVGAVVEASVLRLGDRVRVTARLIDAANDRNLWADRFDRSISDIMAFYSDVARAIADAIKVTVTPAEEAILARGRTVDPAAYEAYLRGRAFAEKFSDEDFEKSFSFLKQAITLDPDYAPAYAELVTTCSFAHIFGYLTYEEAYQEARRAVSKAMELDDELSDAHVAMGLFRYVFEWDWQGADAAFRRALSLDPGNAAAHVEYGRFLVHMSQRDESIAEIRRALDRAPLSIWVNQNLGWALYHTRQYDEAIAQFKRTQGLLEQFPDLLKQRQTTRQLLWCYLLTGRYEAAFAVLDELGDWVAPDAYDRLWAYVASGRREEIAGTIQSLLAQGAHEEPDQEPCVVHPWGLAILGEADRAIRCLEAIYERHGFAVIWMTTSPEYDGIRSNPRFQDLLDRLNLPWSG
jgi:TolB-like protein